jgi:hypothetical protein
MMLDNESQLSLQEIYFLLKNSEKLVFLFLVKELYRFENNLFKRQRIMGDDAGCSRGTINKSIRILRELNLVVTHNIRGWYKSLNYFITDRGYEFYYMYKEELEKEFCFYRFIIRFKEEKIMQEETASYLHDL